MKKQIKILIGIAIILCCFVGVASAEDNLTNATNSSITEPIEEVTPLYVNTAEYQDNYNYWLSYYRNQSQPSKEQIKAYLLDETQDNETRFNNVLSYIGRDDKLLTFLDESKRSIDDYTGEITYDLGVGNWWANLFGAGINEDDLPQNVAQGNALYDIYMERYNLITLVELEIYNE